MSTYVNPAMRRLLLAGLLLAPAAQAQVANGSFETGDFTGWTVGGTGRAAVVQNINFRTSSNGAAPMPAVPQGSRFAALSTGPGNTGGSAVNLDANAYSDFDVVSLTGNIVYSGRPAVLMFSYNFASSEPDQATPYDDIFDVRVGASTVLTGSVTLSSGNSSPFPDFPNPGIGTVNWTINAGVLNGTSLTRGVGQWRRICLPLEGATTGTYSIPVSFRVADQRDSQVDSALLIDNVRVAGACDDSPGVTVVQRTQTAGSTVEIKGSGFVYRPVQQYQAASNRAGGTVQAFISSANLTGTNPNVIEQPIIRTASGYQAIPGLAISNGGEVQSINLSDDGNWVVVAARPTSGDNLEIYRYNRNDSTSLLQMTDTTGCSNRNPVISTGSAPIVAFESTCNSLTGDGTLRKVVYIVGNATGTPREIPEGNCPSMNPSISSNGDFIGMESSCNPPGRVNGDGNMELFVFRTASNQPGTSSRWRQVTNTSGSANQHFSLSLANSSDNFGNTAGIFISNANLTSGNTDGSTEVFRWQGSGTTSNNGSLTRVTDNPVTGRHYTQVQLASLSNWFAFERIDALSGAIEVGAGNTGSGTPQPVAIGGTFLGLGVAETATEVIVPFVAAEDITGDNPDANYELFEGRITK